MVKGGRLVDVEERRAPLRRPGAWSTAEETGMQRPSGPENFQVEPRGRAQARADHGAAREGGGRARPASPAARFTGGAPGLLLLLLLAVAQAPVGIGIAAPAAAADRTPCELVLGSWNPAKLEELREVSRILHLRLSDAADHGVLQAPPQVPHAAPA
jgi:hypothetical protein